jgi:hypothetical protein
MRFFQERHRQASTRSHACTKLGKIGRAVPED